MNIRHVRTLAPPGGKDWCCTVDISKFGQVCSVSQNLEDSS